MNTPNSLEAEKAVLSSIILHSDHIYEAVNILDIEHFYSLFNQKVFETILSLYRQNIAIDVVILMDVIEKDKKASKSDIKALLMDILSSGATKDHFNYYVAILKEKKHLRDFLNLSNEINEDINNNIDVADIKIKINQVLDINEDIAEIVNIKNCNTNILDRYEDFKTGKREYFKTGFSNYDAKTGGFSTGSLNTIAAKTGAGKTTFALNIAAKAALKGKNVLIFSLEVDIFDLINKLISSLSSIPYHKIRSCFMSELDYNKYIKTLEKLNKLDIDFCDKGGLDIYKLLALIKSRNKRKKVDLIIVDNLQLVSTKNYPNNKNLQTGEITSKLKAIARDLQTHIVLVSQLSRESSKQDRRPILADLRDSGSIEQDSDTVTFLYDNNIIVAKNRHGKTGDINVIFEGGFSRFKEV